MILPSVPPFGQDEIEDIESIFERDHLRKSAIFLNVQCEICFILFCSILIRFPDRMPPQIGAFISEEIYEGQLHSNPFHPEAKTKNTCFFVDVRGGIERMHETSYEV